MFEKLKVVDGLMVFTDGSVNVQTGIGYGACLVVRDAGIPFDRLKKQVQVKRFEFTSSTKLELQTLLWALCFIKSAGGKITVYSDSQNILGLSGRREKLEQNNYRAKNNRLLNNCELYMELFQLFDMFTCEFVKVKGHKVSYQKDGIDRLFTLVDRASRNALREEMGKLTGKNKTG